MAQEIWKEPKRITPEQVRQCERFKDYSETEIQQIVDSIEQLAMILFEHYKSQNKDSHEHQQPPSSI